MYLRSVAALCLAALAACGPAAAPAPPAAAAPDSAALAIALQPLVAGYRAALLAGDATALTALYTDSAVVDLTGIPTTVGKAAIMAANSATFAAAKFSEWTTTVRSTVDFGGGRGAQTGTWTDAFTNPKGTMTSRWGRWVTGVTKGTDGTWRISYLMAMTDSTKATPK